MRIEFANMRGVRGTIRRVTAFTAVTTPEYSFLFSSYYWLLGFFSLGYSMSIVMRVHISIHAFNADSHAFIYFYDDYASAIAVIHFLFIYIYDHDRLYKYYMDIYYDYSGSTTSMRTRCRAAYRTLFETVVALLLPSREDRAVTRRQ